MKSLIGVVIVVGVAACTERNPEFCGDGTCIDPSKPYCDYYGDFGGKPGTCIAVTCNPGEFALCRDQTAVGCSATGNGYEATQCPLGCDVAAGGCRQCTDNNQCAAGLLCDMTTSSCRGCRTDDECGSKVCDLATGMCVPESGVLYASPNGPGGGTAICSLAQPCSIDKAITVAANSPSKPIVRMLPGTYTAPLKMDVPNQSVNVVGTGATMFVIGDIAALVVEAGATLEVRGLNSTSERQAQCGLASTTAPFSNLKLRDVTLSSANNGLAFETQRCALTLTAADLTTNGSDLLLTRDDSTFKADRLHVHSGGTVTSLIAGGAGAHLTVTNSVLEETNIVIFFNDATGPASSLQIAYSTVYNSNGIEMCRGSSSPYIGLQIENSIIAASGTFDALRSVTPGTCTLTGTILSHQATTLAGASVADPKFVNVGSYDFHVTSGSPAIDAAVNATVSSDHDVEGTERPAGAAPDIGAYELH